MGALVLAQLLTLWQWKASTSEYRAHSAYSASIFCNCFRGSPSLADPKTSYLGQLNTIVQQVYLRNPKNTELLKGFCIADWRSFCHATACSTFPTLFITRLHLCSPSWVLRERGVRILLQPTQGSERTAKPEFLTPPP